MEIFFTDREGGMQPLVEWRRWAGVKGKEDYAMDIPSLYVRLVVDSDRYLVCESMVLIVIWFCSTR